MCYYNLCYAHEHVHLEDNIWNPSLGLDWPGISMLARDTNQQDPEPEICPSLHCLDYRCATQLFALSLGSNLGPHAWEEALY